jgi:uncharacterized membrane protein YkvA (DUF1232 family)
MHAPFIVEKSLTLKERLSARARGMKRQLGAVYYAYRDPRVGFLPRLIILVALAYSLSPVDLIPDFIPVLGYLDDLILVPALIGLAIRLIPAKVMAEAIARAEKEPLTLRRNWFFGVLFIAAWILVLVGIAGALMRLFRHAGWEFSR